MNYNKNVFYAKADTEDDFQVKNEIYSKCKKVDVGTLEFRGFTHIGDPCLIGWTAKNLVRDLKIAPGVYQCSYWNGSYECDVAGQHYFTERGRAYGIYLDGNVHTKEDFQCDDQLVGVDSGVLGFFNTDDDIKVNTNFRDGKYDGADNEPCIVTDDGFCWHTDDGGYAVFTVKNDSGEVIAVEIRYDEDYVRE